LLFLPTYTGASITLEGFWATKSIPFQELYPSQRFVGSLGAILSINEQPTLYQLLPSMPSLQYDLIKDTCGMSWFLPASACLVNISGGALFIGALLSMAVYGITTLQV